MMGTSFTLLPARALTSSSISNEISWALCTWGVTLKINPKSSKVKDGIGRRNGPSAIESSLSGADKIGEKLALMIGNLSPMLSVAGNPSVERN